MVSLYSHGLPISLQAAEPIPQHTHATNSETSRVLIEKVQLPVTSLQHAFLRSLNCFSYSDTTKDDKNKVKMDI
jgi:hypothetical protein